MPSAGLCVLDSKERGSKYSGAGIIWGLELERLRQVHPHHMGQVHRGKEKSLGILPAKNCTFVGGRPRLYDVRDRKRMMPKQFKAVSSALVSILYIRSTEDAMQQG